ncbi:MAG: peptidoglycan DD-metalloendopeptidase family protein [Candidatus Cloacimonadaceae bacterium]|jgi:septal ring factor EnvC (AmiA/AmiB activator)|nr:peptidoglycan DD-metalloendopeptidase family protein [Candidatus Cloacimonadota bacterium]MDY0126564.1 peptidoglycan DD-metalloendopeptidase family protein [Candidatus Cloacimonadaceae bacterium]MCB5254628.1 peptidoglycan DD-metalloendopeptidase family protein [Candidatus Cloacimonadota bacterium]MCK9177715.1 peptidoglycan DD-metalloendopeptidase family protein [Candidatus Cloacimonadota bacterium]MCK9241889.1 peptidoglycan DD-metalloendopeptidase family protein [Candidatus Cloacimonadota ba
MRKTLIVMILIMSGIVLYADDIDDKVRELQRLKSELENTENKVKETAAKKKTTQSEIQRTSSLKNITEQNLKKHQSEHRTVRDSLSRVQRQIQIANQRLEGLHQVQNDQLNILLRVDCSYRNQGISHRDHRYLKELILHNRRSIDILGGFKVSLEQAQKMTSNQAARISRNLRNEKQKSSRYNKQIRNLTNQSQKLTAEENALKAYIAKLRQDAAELETLINRLMAESGREPSSYEFTQARILWPVRGEIIRNFGQETRSYNTSVVSNGVDIAVREGTKVVAVDSGEVVFADRYGGQGKMIIIDHQNGFFSLYGFNSDLVVKRGDSVSRGQMIARSGMTGSANQPSLHFELRKDGAAINPVPYFEP